MLRRERREKRYKRKSRELMKQLKKKYGFKSKKDIEDFLELAEMRLELQLLDHVERKSCEKINYIA